jgi:AMMECR1 domain-containing protein
MASRGSHGRRHFLTLMKDGKLRGCIGSLQAARSLRDDIRENALAAAFRDPRFPALSAEEWPYCSLEVSWLSTPKTIRFADEADLLAQVRAGEDGIILEHAEMMLLRRSGTGCRTRSVLRNSSARIHRGRTGPLQVRRYRVAKWKEGSLH